MSDDASWDVPPRRPRCPWVVRVCRDDEFKGRIEPWQAGRGPDRQFSPSVTRKEPPPWRGGVQERRLEFLEGFSGRSWPTAGETVGKSNQSQPAMAVIRISTPACTAFRSTCGSQCRGPQLSARI